MNLCILSLYSSSYFSLSAVPLPVGSAYKPYTLKPEPGAAFLGSPVFLLRNLRSGAFSVFIISKGVFAMTKKCGFTAAAETQRDIFRRNDRHLDDLFSVSWRGPFEGFSASRKAEIAEPSFSQTEMRWRGPFEGVR